MTDVGDPVCPIGLEDRECSGFGVGTNVIGIYVYISMYLDQS